MDGAASDDAKRYKDTVFLPRPDFPMRAGLPQKEPEILARWQQQGLDARIRAAGGEAGRFLLHDGPPYANGHIHIGHAANKILKDVINRAQFTLGKAVNYVPGWDCHGLPIEWKIEEQYRAAGKNKDDVPILEFRQECRAFAEHWVAVQSEEFQRLGVSGNWDQPYTTMTPAAEAAIVAEIHKFVDNGLLYRGVRPVMWSVVEKTALAEAEVEYAEHKSITVWVRFPVVTASRSELEGAAVVIWTTTPWTLPGNRATAYGAELTYAVYTVDAVTEQSRARPAERQLLCTALAESVKEAAGITAWSASEPFPGRDLAGSVLAHPWRGQGYDFDVPMLPGDFVTAEQGTGIVHIAPGHGTDDFALGRAHGIAVPETVGDDGRYYADVPLFAGLDVYTADGAMGAANPAVLRALTEAGALLAKGSLRHSYPHSWRSKAPLIFRTTPQWFIAMDQQGLREKALAEIERVTWYPRQGQNRIAAMVAGRPDWCISRQRAWGVPIAIFVHKRDRTILKDPAVLDRIQQAFAVDGADAWYARDPQDFLGNSYDAADYEMVRDVVDVWFESGSTHAFVLEQREDLHSPADLYLEGSDQHRGWFHSSLLESVGTRGRAPYDAVLTHGFVLDQQGHKMSKSLGNVVAPEEVMQTYGADILRSWVVNTDYEEDVRIGPDILKAQADLYRRLRNTLRYLVGSLEGYQPAEAVSQAEMPELERYMLHRLVLLDREVRGHIEAFRLFALFRAVHDFCANDLSAFYFDIRKDAIYCDRPDDPKRRAARTVMHAIFEQLVVWLAPVLVFTAEEAWTARHGADAGSVHLRRLPDLPAAWCDTALDRRWDRLRALRSVVTGALEIERAEKRIGASLQAHPTLYVGDDDAAMLHEMGTETLADLAITSAFSITTSAPPADAFTLSEVPGAAVTVALAAGHKCARCWKVLPEVGSHAHHPALCLRCADAVTAMEAAD